MVSSTFRVIGDDHGEYYANSERIIIFLNKHENVEDIISTIIHEYLHHCIKGEDMDEDEEERLIFAMQWAHESLV